MGATVLTVGEVIAQLQRLGADKPFVVRSETGGRHPVTGFYDGAIAITVVFDSNEDFDTWDKAVDE